jgi:radical SAM protein with 4Fe4S-binding SPASM domain
MQRASNYDLAPLMLYWELTRACDLACRHCRAEARLARFGEAKPHLVFTGGDPLRRPDLLPLVAHAVDLGFVTSVTPSGTPLLTRDAIVRLRANGAHSLAFSLDGSTAGRHDSIRGVDGSFQRTTQAVRWSLEQNIPVQINTLVSAETAVDLPSIYRLVSDLGAQRWALFFLIGTGRGAVLREVTAEDSERILEWLYECSRGGHPVIKTTEAHHFRRVAAQQRLRERRTGASATRETSSIQGGWGIRDGAGIMFISHRGDIYPSGFLPVSAGNVRRDDPVRVYREAALFRQLRDADRLKGKCGECEFRVICGGSRSRAYAATGDPLESDPLCAYTPQPRPAEAPIAV